MSLKHALLGFLNIQSMTGYELKQYFNSSVRHFWNASLSQIYPELNRMKTEGLLDVETVHNENSPDAKRYRITSLGREELVSWLGEPMEHPQLRSPMLVKLYFGAAAGKEPIAARLREQMELSERMRETYREGMEHLKTHEGDGMTGGYLPYWSAAADFGLKFEEFFRGWCADTIKRLNGESLDETADTERNPKN